MTNGRKKLSGSAALVVTTWTGWTRIGQPSCPIKDGPDIVLDPSVDDDPRVGGLWADVTRAAAVGEKERDDG